MYNLYCFVANFGILFQHTHFFVAIFDVLLEFTNFCCEISFVVLSHLSEEKNREIVSVVKNEKYQVYSDVNVLVR